MKNALSLALLVAAPAIAAPPSVLDVDVRPDGWRVVRLDADGVPFVADGTWSGDGVDAFTVLLGAPDPFVPGSQVEWLRACRKEASEACRDAKQELCWVYAQHNGGTPSSSATCLFACRTSDGCPPYPTPPAAPSATPQTNGGGQ